MKNKFIKTFILTSICIVSLYSMIFALSNTTISGDTISCNGESWTGVTSSDSTYSRKVTVDGTTLYVTPEDYKAITAADSAVSSSKNSTNADFDALGSKIASGAKGSSDIVDDLDVNMGDAWSVVPEAWKGYLKLVFSFIVLIVFLLFLFYELINGGAIANSAVRNMAFTPDGSIKTKSVKKANGSEETEPTFIGSMMSANTCKCIKDSLNDNSEPMRQWIPGELIRFFFLGIILFALFGGLFFNVLSFGLNSIGIS